MVHSFILFEWSCFVVDDTIENYFSSYAQVDVFFKIFSNAHPPSSIAIHTYDIGRFFFMKLLHLDEIVSILAQINGKLC